MNKIDLRLLDEAQQSVDLAKQSIVALHKGASDMMLAEHAYDMIEAIAKIDQKLRRLLTVAQTTEG